VQGKDSDPLRLGLQLMQEALFLGIRHRRCLPLRAQLSDAHMQHACSALVHVSTQAQRQGPVTSI
jgi:hypothetical protein